MNRTVTRSIRPPSELRRRRRGSRLFRPDEPCDHFGVTSFRTLRGRAPRSDKFSRARRRAARFSRIRARHRGLAPRAAARAAGRCLDFGARTPIRAEPEPRRPTSGTSSASRTTQKGDWSDKRLSRLSRPDKQLEHRSACRSCAVRADAALHPKRGVASASAGTW